MSHEHLVRFGGKTVRTYDPATGIGDPAGMAFRLVVEPAGARGGGGLFQTVRGVWGRLTGETPVTPSPPAPESWPELLDTFLAEPESERVEGRVVGSWLDWKDQSVEAKDVVRVLTKSRERLPRLESLFFGDLISEECEVSWLELCDVSSLLAAYPDVEHLGFRGGSGLVLGPLDRTNLKTLILQSGGLSPDLVRAVGGATLPALTHLELWLGDPDCGGDTKLEDLEPFLTPARFPSLRTLGIKNSVLQDDIAIAVSRSGIMEQLDVLDLSEGTLGDTGARALLSSPHLPSLKTLDVHHHYMSDAVVAELAGIGIEIDTSDRQEPDTYDSEEHRYVAVSE